MLLGQVSDEGDFRTNVMMQLIGFNRIDAARSIKLVHQPVHQGIVI
jgi:hypothetical protein